MKPLTSGTLQSRLYTPYKENIANIQTKPFSKIKNSHVKYTPKFDKQSNLNFQSYAKNSKIGLKSKRSKIPTQDPTAILIDEIIDICLDDRVKFTEYQLDWIQLKETENMQLQSIITEKNFEIDQLKLKLDHANATISQFETELKINNDIEQSINSETVTSKIYKNLQVQYQQLLEQFEQYRSAYTEQLTTIHNLHWDLNKLNLINSSHKVQYVNDQNDFLRKQQLKIIDLLQLSNTDELAQLKNHLQTHKFTIEIPKINDKVDFETDEIERDLEIEELENQISLLKSQNLEISSRLNIALTQNSILNEDYENRIFTQTEEYNVLHTKYNILSNQLKSIVEKADENRRKLTKKVRTLFKQNSTLKKNQEQLQSEYEETKSNYQNSKKALDSAKIDTSDYKKLKANYHELLWKMNDVGGIINDRDHLRSKLEAIEAIQKHQQEKITRLLGENLKLRKCTDSKTTQSTNSKIFEILIKAFQTRITEIDQIERDYRTTSSKSKYGEEANDLIVVSKYQVLEKYREFITYIKNIIYEKSKVSNSSSIKKQDDDMNWISKSDQESSENNDFEDWLQTVHELKSMTSIFK